MNIHIYVRYLEAEYTIPYCIYMYIVMMVMGFRLLYISSCLWGPYNQRIDWTEYIVIRCLILNGPSTVLVATTASILIVLPQFYGHIRNQLGLYINGGIGAIMPLRSTFIIGSTFCRQEKNVAKTLSASIVLILIFWRLMHMEQMIHIFFTGLKQLPVSWTL